MRFPFSQSYGDIFNLWKSEFDENALDILYIHKI